MDDTICYGEAEGYPLELDLFFPPDRSRVCPGVVCLHGGGWRGGGREQFHWHARQLAQAGFVAACVSYRLTTNYPAALDDCQLAVRWLRRNASTLSLDPHRLGALGSSAGGYLAACLGVRDTHIDGISSRVQCVADIHGIHDFLSVNDSSLIQMCEDFLGCPRIERPKDWRDASPQYFIDEQTAPMLIVHDPDDDVVPYDQSVRFAAALKSARRAVEFMPVPGAGHGFFYNPSDRWTPPVYAATLAWFNRFLGDV